MICSLGSDAWGPPFLVGSLFSEYVCIFWHLVMFRWYKKGNIDVEFPWECGVGIQGCIQTLGMAGPEGHTNLCSVEQASSATCMEVHKKGPEEREERANTQRHSAMRVHVGASVPDRAPGSDFSSLRGSAPSLLLHETQNP